MAIGAAGAVYRGLPGKARLYLKSPEYFYFYCLEHYDAQ